MQSATRKNLNCASELHKLEKLQHTSLPNLRDYSMAQPACGHEQNILQPNSCTPSSARNTLFKLHPNSTTDLQALQDIESPTPPPHRGLRLSLCQQGSFFDSLPSPPSPHPYLSFCSISRSRDSYTRSVSRRRSSSLLRFSSSSRSRSRSRTRDCRGKGKMLSAVYEMVQVIKQEYGGGSTGERLYVHRSTPRSVILIVPSTGRLTSEAPD